MTLVSERVGDVFAGSGSVVVLPDGSTTTAPQLAAKGRRLAAQLRAEGLVPGDRVAVRLPNGAAYLQMIVACAAARLVLVSVNTRYSDDEAHDVIRRSGARRVVDVSSVFDVSAAPAGLEEIVDVSIPDDPFLVFTTSGTTSKPKMVRHSQRSIAAHGFAAAAAFGYSSDSRDDMSLAVMPFCGTFGMSSLTATLASGSKMVVVDHFDVATVANLITEHHVTVINGSDDMFHRLVEHGADLSGIRLGGYARFNSSLDGIVGRAEKVGARITGLYGMSEVQALFSLRDPSAPTNKRAEAGGTLVSPAAEYRTADGELQVRGPSLFEGYLAEGGAEIDVELTAANFSDGWFRTGDAAEAEDDRTFTYHSRIGDVLRLGGFLVSPADIESVVLEVPGVDAVQVVAVDLPSGARPVAFVISSDGFDADAALLHCQQRLARYKVPVRFVALDQFPTTPSANGNKIQRVKLRELAQELLGSLPHFG
jgi:fatty-acyl-CoA synthase